MSEQNNQTPENFAPVAENTASAGKFSGSPQTPPPPAQPPVQQDNSGGNSMFAIALAIIALLACGYNFWKMQNMGQGEVANVVVVDFDSIGGRLLLSGDSNEVLTKTQALRDKLNALSAQGVVVLQKQSVVTAPATLDITDQLSQELGLPQVPNLSQPVVAGASVPNIPTPQQGIGETKETDGLDASLD